MYQIIDGKKISQEIRDELREKAAALKEQGKTFTLAVIQVGNDPAFSVYVNNKKNACAYVGIESLVYQRKEDTSQEELLELIGELNENPRVGGILVQLPLPEHIDSVDGHLAGQGCGRFPPRQCGKRKHWPSGFRVLYAGGRDPAFKAFRDRNRGEGMRGAGTKQYCGKAHGNAAPAGKRDGYGVSFPDQKPEGDHKARRHPGGGGGKTEVCDGGLCEGGGGGHRRGDPQKRGQQALRGRGF